MPKNEAENYVDWALEKQKLSQLHIKNYLMVVL